MRYSVHKKIIIYVALFLLTGLQLYSRGKEPVLIVQQADALPRIQFGMGKLIAALRQSGYTINKSTRLNPFFTGKVIVAGELDSDLLKKVIKEWKINANNKPGKEGYIIGSAKGDKIFIGGADPSGVLYGCIELIEQIKTNGKLPSAIFISDQPEMVLRGACIGIQKPYDLPGRTL